MTTIKNKVSEREEIEALLPWHAAGTLTRREAQKVEQALAADADLAAHYATIREDLAETIVANETLGAPSARAMQKLMADIEADASTARRARTSFNWECHSCARVFTVKFNGLLTELLNPTKSDKSDFKGVNR